MTEHTWRVSIELPLPSGATEQAKILTKVAGPLETFRKSLPDAHTCDDRVVKVRSDAGMPRGSRIRANTQATERVAAAAE